MCLLSHGHVLGVLFYTVTSIGVLTDLAAPRPPTTPARPQRQRYGVRGNAVVYTAFTCTVQRSVSGSTVTTIMVTASIAGS